MNEALSYLTHIAAQSLLKEVGTTPKPGLVDRHDNGAHKDMCHDTFVASTGAIVPFLSQMAETGFTWKESPDRLFPAIRPIGVEAEKAMFQATHGVNTHKGLIFSLGIIMAAAGYEYQKTGQFHSQSILLLCRDMTDTYLEQDFAAIDPAFPKTHGERLYIKYGCKGIRGEVQSGFAHIRDISLPLIHSLHKQELEENQMFLHVLLELMAQVEDTNVLIRTDPETAEYVKQEARRILPLARAGSWNQLYEAITFMNQDFIRKNISPGGCADLLAVTIFLWLLEQYKGGFQ